MDRSSTKKAALAGGLVFLGALAGAGALVLRARGPRMVAPASPAPLAEAKEVDAGEDEEDDDSAFAFRLPSGRPAELTCEDARRVIAQVRAGLAYEPDAVSARSLASGAADWLDPHGLWSAAPDSPVEAKIESLAPDLVADLEADVVAGAGRGSRGKARPAGCVSARTVGASLQKWVGELRERFDRARASPGNGDAGGAFEEIPFDSIAYSRPAKAFAEDLGRRVGTFERSYGPAARPFGEAARERFFPDIDAGEWSEALLAAAVRAYVPLVDPHGAWAPLDEEESIYEVDLAGRPPPRLWEKSERTAVGVVLGDGALAPLAAGDLLLSVAGVKSAGLPLEQLDQLSYAAADLPEPPSAILLRVGELAPRTIVLAPTDEPAPNGPQEDERLPVDRMAYADGDVALVTIHDVRDDLGDLVARTLAHERGAGGRELVGVVLDLRGNGGGSTDGAIAALGLFMPGVPLFPMRRRDGTVETDRAPDPPPGERWTGPLATLVDGETASAAEMIAGALAVYHRAPSVGAPTYGKGCAQEYLDDDAHAGVLRLTTLLYALPDGAPVQRVGLTPSVGLPLTPAEDPEREATLAHAPPTWRGPDVRERRVAEASEAWPPHGGRLGPCKDADVCKALHALGGAASKNVRATRGGGRR